MSVGGLNLKGYFQSELYFEHCSDQVRHYFKPTKHIHDKLVLKYGNMSDTCSIHVRRGDYVNHPLHEVANIDYYNRAMTEMERSSKVKKYFVFSDDFAWCKKNFIGDKFLFITNNVDTEDLFLMSMCNNHIITNSSFSWWGSWLNQNVNKIVIAPTKWFNGSGSNIMHDIYTKKMIQL